VQILEWGLHYVEAEEAPEVKSASLERQKTLDALRTSGLLLNLDRTLAARYRRGVNTSATHARLREGQAAE
jgi:hypothetical protein